MNNKTLPTALLVSTFLLLALQPAHAHRMRVFAYESGGTVHAEVKFNSGRAARDIPVLVEDENGKQLVTGTTDDNGLFIFPLPPELLETPSNLTIIADTGDGHRGKWLLRAEDYAVSFSPPSSSRTPAPMPETSTQQNESSTQVIGQEHIREMIRQAVAAELAPVKKMLAEQAQRSLSLQDILGGIGYLIGLAGIAAYFQSRKTTTNGGKK